VEGADTAGALMEGAITETTGGMREAV
jgi:hypothetical protein